MTIGKPMTARELIEKLQSFGEENLDLDVLIHDEYRYVFAETVALQTEKNWKDEDVLFIGIS